MPDWLDCAVTVHGNLLDDKMYVITSQVLENQWNVVDEFLLPVADIVCGINVVVNHVIVLVDCASVGVLRIERTVGAVADAALGRFKVAATLRLPQVVHRTNSKLNALGLQLDELIQELL